MHIGKHQIEREQDVFLDEETLFSNQSNDECTFLEGTNLLPIENISPFLDENPNNYGIEIDQHMSDSNHQHTDLTTCTTSTLLDFTNITVNIDENFRDLPPGMKYHFYVSYSSDDSSIVNKIIEELEERFFFKCLNFERDFTPGRRIDQLINEEMNQSEAVLIILSHTYTEKLWCLAEAQLAFEMSFKTNNKIKVIPILIHPLTEELPTILKSIRYIDAEKEEDVAARIHEIYRNPG
ncbi:unnamed protein product [Mytilus edulis]|uniref:TIR domain-containing protein n=1 Tax=Mytilus edulis TaxID=6550 RepID=A0A8S3S6B4_MYTED|nr:unnamed protein product [Mytilus edulis]